MGAEANQSSLPVDQSFLEYGELPELFESSPNMRLVDEDSFIDRQEVGQPEYAVETQTDDLIDTEPQDERGRVERAISWVRRNKVATAAGVITVASLFVNPLGPAVAAIGAKTAMGVLGAEAVLEGAWITGAIMACRAAGLKFKFTLNPSKIRAQFRELSNVNLAENINANREGFNRGIVANTTAAIGEVALPSAVIMANLPVTSWGVLAFGALDLWATFVLRRKLLQAAHTKPLSP